MSYWKSSFVDDASREGDKALLVAFSEASMLREGLDRDSSAKINDVWQIFVLAFSQVNHFDDIIHARALCVQATKARRKPCQQDALV